MDKDNFYNFASLRDSRVLSVPNGLSPTSSVSGMESQSSYNADDREPINHSGGEYIGVDTLDLHEGTSEDGMVREDERKYKHNSRVFLVISVISAALILALEAYMFAVINVHKKRIELLARYSEMSIYLALFIFSGVYQVILTIIGLRTKNMLLLAMLCLFYVAMLIYTGIQYEEVGDLFSKDFNHKWATATKATNIATIAVLALTFVLQAGLLVFVLRDNVKWFRFKKIGADVRIRRMYTLFQIHRALLIFDFYFFLGFLVQFIVIMVNNKLSTEFILTVIVLPLTLVVLFLSDLATTREIYVLTVATLLAFACGCAYVMFKMIRLYTKYTSAYDIGIHPGAYFPGRKSLVTFGVITLVFLLATIVFEVVVMINYRKGLYPFVSTYYKWLPRRRAPKNSVKMQVLNEEKYESDFID